MISVSLQSQASPPSAGAPDAPPGVVPGGARAFGAMLGAGERQPAKTGGKPLPVDPEASADPAPAKTDTPETVAPWLPSLSITDAPGEDPVPTGATDDADPAAFLIALPLPVAVPVPPAPVVLSPSPVAPGRPVMPIAADGAIEILAPATGKGDALPIVVARVPSPAAPVSPPPADAVPPAGPVIAIRTATAVAPLVLAPVMPRAFRPLVTARTPVVALADPEDAATPLPGAITTIAAITPSGPAAAAALDMTRADWPATMIDRIERLRDDADAADTSIRVVPDALGRIHVSLRRDEGGTHVHFAAEQAQTRALLADARPQLAELAEARGLRLAQSSVGGDAGGGQPGHRAPPAAFLPAAPASAAARTAITTDHRIA